MKNSLGRINCEIDLAKNKKICYTYDELARVTKRETENLNTGAVSEENYSYDAAGNIITADTQTGSDSHEYDFNNRVSSVDYEYDLDGNLVCDSNQCFEYDSSNRLIVTREHVYTYDVDNVRIRNCREGYGEEYETTYVYNTNCELSQMLCKTTNGITTKYVYGLGLIGEEKCGEFKTYHFDYRGSTRFITDINGNITDTLEYDAYGKVIRRAGSSYVIFGYNGRDGSVTDANGLIYMRARYYSPELRRFVNADVIKGNISDSTSLNRYAYVNGNPVSYVDPRGLSADQRGAQSGYSAFLGMSPWGSPNTHITEFDNYWKERWYDSQGRAVKDRHWTDHSSPKDHTNPHDQNWNWSDPEHPKLDPPYPPSDDDPKDPPSSEGSEEWNTNESNEKSDESSANKSNFNQTASIGKILLGAGIVTVSTIGLIWLIGNDVSGVGALDDAAVVPVTGFFTYGMRLLFGA